MAKLNFTEKVLDGEKVWDASVEVAGDFNLHLEREKCGYVTLFVSTVEGGMGSVVYSQNCGSVMDRDFSALVYPKYLIVRVWGKPLEDKCYVTESA